MNLESLNLSLEKISKLKVEFGNFLQTQIQKKQNFENMFKKTQNEFGQFSKLKCCVWRILRTQI